MVSVWFLLAAGAITAVPGLIHTFLPDGGAGVIAGIELSEGGAGTVRLFGWAGATQIVWGAILVAIALRFRPLVPLALLLLLAERLLHIWVMWGPKGVTADHKPPEAYLMLGFVPLILLFLILSLRTR
ncbi:hypothetical protein HFP57_07770 [Parasphingopyxis algicola]|uniref:hypothetical protein n=1 Tax=Parasphingopyxis algicola TaxID=2026624 RepID=UPI0015A3738B|nr:hypothetical protein [Parasphingopyxis algicola]QLC24935.1 hypothetical protein HFP57_07770 [Parasphingopyxis algicola]